MGIALVWPLRYLVCNQTTTAMSLNRVLKDPRLVTITHNGEDMHFWYHRSMYDHAKRHGYEGEGTEIDESDEFATGTSLLRLLWMCHLAFEPDLTFEEFDLLFLPSDYEKLGVALRDIVQRQIGVPKDEQEEPKKAKGRSKKK